MLSLWVRRAGNLPALFSPGPKRRGICLIKDSEARKALLLGKLLNLLLVLVKLLQIVCAHAGDALRFGLVTMLLITEHANLELRAGDVLQLDGARETLVLLGIVVLEADLEVHSLHEVPLLGLEGVLQELRDG